MNSTLSTRICIMTAAIAATTACVSAPQPPQPAHTPTVAAANVVRTPLRAAEKCVNRFVEHALPFATGVRVREMRTYLSNGGGVAAGDLDDDGRVDLVFASVDNASKILWNETESGSAGGAPVFRDEALPESNTRAASVVDVDADGRLDVVFTVRNAAPVLLRNLGERRFSRAPLLPNEHFAYTLSFADLNGDGALDVVGAAYHAELLREGYEADERAAHGGVYYYERSGDGYTVQKLADSAQALAIGLIDLDGNGQRDIWIGNDFDDHDQIWLRRDGAWQPRNDWFAVTSHSTMSIDWADLGAAGGEALLTTDMNPGDVSPEVLARWLPMMAVTEQKLTVNDRQLTANVLQVRGNGGAWRNEAARRGVDATGWSWSGRFGDFDNDGLQDVYIVNGMVAIDLFHHLPDGALVEQNRAFRGGADGQFTSVDWGLNSDASGRGMLPVDIDRDGDLDVVVNNLRGSARLYENRLCGGAGLLVELRWGGAPNARAIGAELELRTSQGVLRRDVRAMSGYLAGDAPEVHFGLPAGATIEELNVIWPDGARTRLDGVRPGEMLRIERG
jgi:hypothetical protein